MIASQVECSKNHIDIQSFASLNLRCMSSLPLLLSRSNLFKCCQTSSFLSNFCDTYKFVLLVVFFTGLEFLQMSQQMAFASCGEVGCHAILGLFYFLNKILCSPLWEEE